MLTLTTIREKKFYYLVLPQAFQGIRNDNSDETKNPRKEETWEKKLNRYQETEGSYLGKTSASKTTTSTPSLASTEAEYDPPGPPPITSTVVFSGIDMVLNSIFD
jgi:hypothetical protein